LIGGLTFGQAAPLHQFVGIVCILAASVALFFGAVESGVLRALLVAVEAFGVFWYIIPGHAFVYAPYLFILVPYDLAIAVLQWFRRAR